MRGAGVHGVGLHAAGVAPPSGPGGGAASVPHKRRVPSWWEAAPGGAGEPRVMLSLCVCVRARVRVYRGAGGPDRRGYSASTRTAPYSSERPPERPRYEGPPPRRP